MVIIFVLVLVTLVSCLYILCQIGSKFSSLDHCQLESMLTELFVLCQDGEPCRVGVALIDLSTGLYTILAILSALEHRHKTNTGQHVQCNLLSTQVRVCARAPNINRPISCSCLVYHTQLNFSGLPHYCRSQWYVQRFEREESEVRDLFTLFDIMFLCCSPGGSTDARRLKLAQLSSTCKATWNSTSQSRTESGAYTCTLCFKKKFTPRTFMITV